MDRVVGKWLTAIRSVDEIFRRAIVENQEEILDLNVAQLEQGKDSLGNFLMEYASDNYARFKIAMGSKAPMGIPNLILEGDFTEGFILRYDGDYFVFTSTDEKKDELAAKYGSDLFGLMVESQTEINPELARSFLTHFRNFL